MFKLNYFTGLNYVIGMTSLIFMATTTQPALAQTVDEILAGHSATDVTSEQVVGYPAAKKSRIKRDVEPVPYWVDAESLRLRDNPVAGRIVGKLGYGQRVLAYSQYENWVLISKPEDKQQWVNSDFLSNSRLSWASYNRGGRTRSSDVIAVRIKHPNDRKNRTFGVRLKTAATGNALITTRQDTSQGAYFQNHFVSCSQQQAVGARLVGEGYSFLEAQNDLRGADLDIFNPDQIEDKITDGLDSAISSFACKAQAF